MKYQILSFFYYQDENTYIISKGGDQVFSIIFNLVRLRSLAVICFYDTTEVIRQIAI